MMTTLTAHFILRLAINTVSLIVLVRLCYFRQSAERDFSFSFYLFGTGVFIISYMLHAVEIAMGFAFGLFAIFSMLRYRTETISIKSMTYLFLVITMSLLSAVGPIAWLELILINALICGFVFLADTRLLTPRITEKIVSYEIIENIKPENREILFKDLGQRTGLKICDVQVDRINFLRDTARLKVYFEE